MNARQLIRMTTAIGATALLIFPPVELASRTTAQEKSSPEVERSSRAAVRQYRAAVALQNKQLYDLAAEEWQAFLAEYPQDKLAADARHYLGICLFQQEQYELAEAAFQQALAGELSAEIRLSAMLNLGLTQYNRGSQDKSAWQRCIRSLRGLVRDDPKSEEAQRAVYFLAESLLATGEKAEAIQTYRQGIQRFPQHPERPKLLYGLGVALQEDGQHEAASRVFEELWESFPNDPFAAEAQVRRGDSLLELGQIKAAAKVFSAAAKNRESPMADYALLRYAACQFRNGDFADAGGVYASVVEQYPQSPHRDLAVLGAGKSFYLADDLTAAKQWLEKAVSLGGEAESEAIHYLARCDIKTGSSNAAVERLQSALPDARGKQRVQLQLDLADALFEIPERRQESFHQYKAIADEFGRHEFAPQARYLAAFVALDAHEYDRALAQAAKFVADYPDDELWPDVKSIEAESLLQQSKYELAAQTWRELVERFRRHKDRTHWINRRAICLNGLQQPAEVIAWLAPLLADVRDPAARGESLFLLGSAQFQSGQMQAAVELLKQSLAIAPEGVQADRAQLLLAKAQSSSDPQSALAAIDRLLGKGSDPTVMGEAHFAQAELLYADGRFPAAATGYRTALEVSPVAAVQAQALAGLAWSHLEAGNQADAIRAAERLRSEFPQNALASKSHYVQAVALQQTKQFADAVQHIELFLRTRPPSTERADALYLRGLCLAGLEKYKAAVNSFQEAMAADENYPAGDRLLYELAWAQESGGQEKSAARSFEELARRYPQSPLAAEGHFRAGEYSYQKQAYAQARRGYAAAIKAAGEQTELLEKARHKLSWTYYQEGDFARAREAFQQQLQQSATGDLAQVAVLMAAECAFQEDEFSQALTEFLKGLMLPGGDNALRSLSLLHAGQAAARLEKWDDSLQLLLRVAAEHPNSEYLDEARYETAWALQKLNRIDEALLLYEKVAEATDKPIAARARFMQGELQFAAKQYPEAIRTFFKVAYGYGYPNSPQPYQQWQADAMFEAARCCESTKRVEAAERLYRDLVQSFPESDKVELAKKKLAALR